MKRIHRVTAIVLALLFVILPLCPELPAPAVASAEGDPAAESEQATPQDSGEIAADPPAPADAQSNLPASTPADTAAEANPGASNSETPTAPDTNSETTPASDSNLDGAPTSDPDVNAGGGSEDPAPDEAKDPLDDPSNDAPDSDTTTAPGTEGSSSPDPTTEDDLPPAIDYTQSAIFSPAFESGYAEVIGETTAYAGAETGDEAIYALNGGVVYALRRSASSQGDRLEVAFDFGGSVCTAWIDAVQLRPLSPEQVASFTAERSTQDGALFLNSDPQFPLDAPECAPLPTASVDSAPAAPSLPKLILSQTEITLGAGESFPIEFSFDDGQPHAIQYESNAPGVASVSEDGTVTARAAGEAIITLRGEFEGEASLRVTVKGAPAKIGLSAPRTTLGVNESIQLKVALPEGALEKYSFSTSNAAVATVSPDGKVIPFAPGAATITVTAFNGVKASVALTVKPAPASVSLDRTELRLGVGQAVALKATLTAGSAGSYEYRVEAGGGIVSVDPSTGAVKALAPGNTVITVETYNHQTASCAVEVLPAPEELAFEQSAISIGLKESASVPIRATAGGQPAAASYTYSTSNKKIATVSSSGVIKGVKTGKATITVKAHNGAKATITVTVKNAPKKAYLSAPRTTLGVGESVQLKATTNSGTASRKFTYTSSNAAVANVDPNTGVVTAVAPGTATITAKTFNGIPAKLKITVKAAPESITLNVPAAPIGVGQPCKLTATLPANTAGAYTFESLKPDIATVDANTGAVTAIAEGEAWVKVTTFNGFSDTKTFKVVPAPESITLAFTSVTVGKGESIAFPGITLPEGTAASYTYSTSNKKIATVSGSGVIKGVKAGKKATITVKTHNGVKATVTVTVKNAPKKAYLSAPRTTLGVDESVQLKATTNSGTASRKFTYTSSNAAVASVDNAGVVTAVAPGTATITAKTFNGKKATLKLTVKAAPESITLNVPAAPIGVGQPCKLTATLPANTAGAYTFESLMPDIATVDPNTGAVTAIAEGEAQVKVTTFNEKSDVKTFEIVPAPESITLAFTSVTVGKGESIAFPGITLPEGTAASYTYSTSSKKIATVSSSGKIKGVKAGKKATITVKTHNGVKATVTVTVKNAPKKAYLSTPRTTLGVGESVQLKATTNSGTASRGFTYTSSNAGIASVDKTSGLVSAVAPGTATITAKTYNGKTAKLKITVKAAPESITLNVPAAPIGVGQPCKLTATLPANTAGAYTFESLMPDIATVDPNTGAVTAIAQGTAEVKVTAYNEVFDIKSFAIVPAPTSISLAFTSVSVGKGESIPFPGITLPEGTAASYTYSTSNKKIATVSGSGVIKGVKAGKKATITVKTHNGVKATVTVTVKNAPKKAYLSAPHTTLGEGEVIQLKATTNSGTASRRFTYTSSNAAVANVDPNTGVVTAVAPGTATITAKTYNGVKATLKITVKTAPEAAALPETLKLGKGEKFTISTTLSPAGSGGGLTYSSDDASVATINAATGAITATGTGTTTIRVKTYNDKPAECALTVVDAPTSIALQDKSFTLAVGDTRQLLPPVIGPETAFSRTITYKSSSTKYARVSGSGLVTGVKAGKSTITVSTYNGKKASITVTVKAAAKSISFKEKEHRLFIDRRFTPEVLFNNGVAGSYTLTSSDPNIARIEGREVVGVTSGRVTITAESYNHKRAMMTVWVPALPDSVWFEPSPLTLGEGDSAKLTVCTPAEQGAEMSFSEPDSAVATIARVDNETITVTAQGKGETTITVTSQNGKQSTATVKVLKAPSCVTLSPSRAGRSIDEKELQLTWGYGGSDEGGSVRFSSSDSAIASVSSTGLVTFHKVGSVRITVTTYNGHSSACELKIGEKPTRMFFAQEEYLVAQGDSIYLPASFDKGCESYALSSQDAGVAAVSGEVVRGVELGSTTLTALSRSGLTASCTVRVVPEPEGVELDVAQAELVVGINSTQQLHATPLPDGAGSVTFFSSNPAVAIVDSATGVVTAKGKGECVIYARTYNGRVTECPVRVSYLLEGVKIGIDPGHQKKANLGKESSSPKGGSSKYKVSSGAHGVSTHRAEHTVNLEVGLLLRKHLERLGATVYMTRETANVNISNKQRAIMMNNAGVDLVLRLHCNSADTSSAKGLEIHIRKTCAYSSKDVPGGSSKLLSNEDKAARKVYNAFVQATGCKKRGVKKNNNYTMNNWSKVPCLLVEMGFMSNSAEDKNLSNPSYQLKMVKGMINGICDYKGLPRPTEW